jgi:metal-responsive CopG/Arc/MetJ family transcriptional regulator
VRETVTISLPAEVRRELDRIAARDGVSRSDVLRASFEEYLFARRFRALRQRMMAAAQARGIHTDEDVFERVS